MAKSEKPSVNKADFVRSIGLDVRAKDVVQKAASAGFSLSEAYVYGVRKEMGSKSSPSKPGDKARAAKTAQPAAPVRRGPSGPRAGSKKAFVLSFPTDTPARDILEAASAKGMEMSAGYVYWVRSDATRTGRRAAAAGSSSGRPVVASRAVSNRLPSLDSRSRGVEAERLIVDTAIRVVGIERAIAILEAARGKLDRLIADLTST